MNTTLADALPQLEEQLGAAVAEAQAARERVEALEQVVGGIKRLNGRAAKISVAAAAPRALFVVETDPANQGGPRGREAVRAVTREHGGIWQLKDLVAEVIGRGWAESPKSVEVSVHRLARSGECRRVGIGVYEFPATTEVDSP